jgi:hypothetical protein
MKWHAVDQVRDLPWWIFVLCASFDVARAGAVSEHAGTEYPDELVLNVWMNSFNFPAALYELQP